MARIVSVWLPRWPIQRFLAETRRSSNAPVDPARPFVLAAESSGVPCIIALNAAAEAEGLVIGDTLADARAKAGLLQVHAADPLADHAALRRLALWATRYTPAVASWGEESGADGLFLDITGASHLFGGEEKLLDDLAHRLARFGLPARLAVAETAGTAWALARFHSTSNVILPAGQESAALFSLPIEALRLLPETRATLRRLGFKRIGMLIDKPRAPFAARFEKDLLRRLDQALGRTPEPLVFIIPPPVYHSLRYLLEPVFTQEAVVAIATRLMRDIVHALVRDGVGARSLRLALYRVDGEVKSIDIGLTLPTRSPSHVARLIDLKLDRMTETLDAGFGFEALGLAVTVAERMDARQTELASASDGNGSMDERCAELIDGLRQRLGPHSVRRLAPIESHLPERAETRCAANAVPARFQAEWVPVSRPESALTYDSRARSDAKPVSTFAERALWPAPDETRPRPLLLFARAEPADVTALVPEGPPRRFRWRGVTHGVARAQGPERIAGEWWRKISAPTRDYYLVEDEAGRRFWLYREGLFGRETASPRWFVHGLFA